MAGERLVLLEPQQVAMPDGGVLLLDHATSGKGVWVARIAGDGSDALPATEISYDEYADLRAKNPDLDLPEMKPPEEGAEAGGNTVGRVVGETPAADVPAAEANPEVSAETAGEASVGTKVLDGVQLGLDVIGLIPGAGEVADLANAGISALRGDYVGAGLSLAAAIPFAGWFGAGAKFARRGVHLAEDVGKGMVKHADEAADAARAAAKHVDDAGEAAAKHVDDAGEAAAKEADDAAEAGAKEADDAAEEAATKNNAQVKKAKKLKCGDKGSYGDLKKQSGDNQFDRDHVPSKAALLERAKQIAAQKGIPFTSEMANDIIQLADAVAIPKASHREASPTYGQRGKPLIGPDAADLVKAARRDLDKMLGELNKTDPRCYKKYKRFANKLMKAVIENKDVYDDFLLDVITG